MKKIALPLLVFIAVVILAGCPNSTTGTKRGGGGGSVSKVNLTINLSPTANNRAVPPAEVLRDTEYEITLSGGGSTISLSAKGVSNVRTNVTPGYWTVSIRAFYKGVLIGSGSEGVEVKAGQNNSVIVTLYADDSVDLADLPGHTNPITIREGTGAARAVTWDQALETIRTGGSGKEYTINITGTVSITGQTGDNDATIGLGTVTGIIVTLTGTGTLQLSGGGCILQIGSSQTVNINGPTFKGINSNTAPLFHIISGTLNLNSGTISGNTNNHTSISGGGVYITGGTFTMTGGNIINNSARAGGGIYATNYSNLTIKGGTINGNTATAGSGGGIACSTNSILTIEGGTISGNESSSSDGGGITISSSTTFNMTGGIIRGNTSGSEGGGVRINGNSTFNMSGTAVISGNTTTGGGGGVYISNSSDASNNNNNFYKTGGIIYGIGAGANSNTAGNGNGHAVYWANGARIRNTTLNTGDNLSTGDTTANSGWGQ